jgi:chromosome segregation ATPase
MNIDNSGTTLVIDPKSQAAIDAVRDRITLLESENTRLTKLKANLDADVRKMEADLAYKTDLVTEIENKLEAAISQLDKVTADADEAARVYNEMIAATDSTQKVIQDHSEKLAAREKDLNEREFALDARREVLSEGEKDLEVQILAVQSKKEALTEVLTKL